MEEETKKEKEQHLEKKGEKEKRRWVQSRRGSMRKIGTAHWEDDRDKSLLSPEATKLSPRGNTGAKPPILSRFDLLSCY